MDVKYADLLADNGGLLTEDMLPGFTPKAFKKRVETHILSGQVDLEEFITAELTGQDFRRIQQAIHYYVYTQVYRDCARRTTGQPLVGQDTDIRVEHDPEATKKFYATADECWQTHKLLLAGDVQTSEITKAYPGPELTRIGYE